MKTHPLAVVDVRSLTLALFVSLAGLPAGAAVFDDFESYAVGSNLHGQGGWSGWAGNPGAGALVSTSFSFSPTRAVNVTGDTDLVRTFSGATNGQWMFQVMQYVPSTSSGTNYVILLNRYQPPFGATELNWSVQIQNNLDTGQIVSDLGGGATRPMVKNQWVEVRVEINLASNTVTEFYNGQPLSSHVWQDGTGLNELQALDFFAADAGPVYYDNVSLAPAAPPSEVPPTSLRISNTGPNLEGLPTFKLEWDAISNATYLVQSADSLAPGSPWTTLDAVIVPDKAGSYQIQVVATDSTGLLSPTKFYRLILPQPGIVSVEPAIFAPGVAVDAFVIGQCFESNDVVRVDGVPLGGVIYLSNNMLQGPLPTLSVGSHLVELVRGGVVQSSFTVTCADPVATPELALQGPPEEPLASPFRVLKTKTKSNQSNDRLIKTKTKSNQSNDRVLKTKTKSNQSNDRLATATMEFMVEDFRYKVDHKRVVGGGGGVVLHSGEVQECAVDMVIPGRGLDFVWARTYRSRPGVGLQITIKCWTHSYDVAVAQTAAGIAVADGTGRLDTFKLQTNGVYTCPEFFREGTISNNTFTLTFADTGRWVFHPFDNSPAAGKLFQIITRNGDTMTLGYDSSGRLTQIVDDLDRTNTVTYDSAGRLARLTDFLGRPVSYQYYEGLPGEPGGAGDLKSVTSPPVTGTPNGNDFPAGKTTTYTYSTGYLDDRENHLLLTIADSDGRIVRKYVYQHNQTNLDFLRCISVQQWTNTPTLLTYLPQTATPANQFATLRCILNDPVGDVTESFFDARGRCVKSQEFTGRATPGQPVTAAVNRPTGKLRASDPAYYETLAEWNNDSLLSKIKREYSGDKTFRYASDFDPATPARKRADLRVVREIASSPVDLDGDGVADTSERVWRFDYDPRFGSSGDRYLLGLREYNPTKQYLAGDTQIYNMRTRLKELEARLQNIGILARSSGGGWGKVDNSDLEVASARAPAGVTHEYHRFATSATDPRGNVMTITYDTKGNATSQSSVTRDYGHTPEFVDWKKSYAYDPHGQLTAITNAADANGVRRVDTFTWSQGQMTECVVDASAGGLALTSSFEYDARGNLTRCIDPRTNDWLYTYNSLDQCVRVQSPVNLTARCASDFFYDANDNLVQTATEVRDASDTLVGTQVDRCVVDPLHRVTEIALAVDASHALTNRFAYDGAGQCVLALGGDAVSGADPHQAVACEYDERGLLFREIAAPGSPDQSTTQFDYDANGLVTRVSEGLEGVPSITTMEYDGFARFGGRGKAQGVMGQKAKAWMVNNFEVHPLAATGKKMMGAPKIGEATAVFNISQAGELLAWVETVWNKQCVEKDTTVRLSKITDPMGNVTAFYYDANDNLKDVRHFGETNDVPGTNENLRLAETRYDYDGLDRRVRVHAIHHGENTQLPVGDGEATTTLAYAANGQCTSVTDDLGLVTSFEYDTAGRPRMSNAVVVKKVLVRDRAGNVTSVIETNRSSFGGADQVFACTYVYDSLNRCVSSTDSAGNTSSCAYDSLGRVVKTTDAAGGHAFYSYDLLDRGTVVVGDLDGDGVPEFDADITEQATWSSSNGRLLATTDSHGNTTSYAYDSRGRCTTVTQADGTQQALVWSPRSNLIQETDANGTVITNSYDLNDRLVHRDIATSGGGGGAVYVEAFTYDGCDRLISHHDDDCDGDFAYDSLGNCVRETLNGLATTSTYDALGNRLTLTYPGGRALAYAYDASSRCTSITESGTALASFDYSGLDRISRITYGNGMRTLVAYDGLVGPLNGQGDHGFGQVSRVRHGLTAGAPVVSDCKITWDQKQNKTARTVAIPGAGGRTNEMMFAYDAADRLVQAVVLNGATLFRNTTYGLDRMGNRTNVTGAASCSGNYFMDQLVPGPLDFQMNQYTTMPCDSRSYDENGNLVSRGSAAGPVTYQYDYADRLVQVQAIDFSSGSAVITTSSYAYDALGRRISKSVSSGGLPPTTVQYVYCVKFEYAVTPYKDGEANEMRSRPGNVIEERENGLVTASFVLDGTRSHDDGVIQMRRAGQDYYYHTDDQGNTLALTTTGGAVVERYDYDDYGAVTFLTSDGLPTSATASAVGNPYCWGGLRLDAETGLHNNDGRGYHEPQSGRVITVPWIANQPSIPHRISAGNNPWSGGEPVGMQKGTVKFFNEAKGFGRVGSGGPFSTSTSSFQKMKDSVIQNIR